MSARSDHFTVVVCVPLVEALRKQPLSVDSVLKFTRFVSFKILEPLGTPEQALAFGRREAIGQIPENRVEVENAGGQRPAKR